LSLFQIGWRFIERKLLHSDPFSVTFCTLS
jgi:hypothetical protein